MAKNILILILILFLIAIIYQVFFNNPQPDTIELNLNGSKYNLEVAKTIPQRTKGLMGRSTLPGSSGMIFIFDFDIPQTFWMKNTLIPLDMIFIKSDGTITNILTATPEPSTPDNQLKLYHSTSPVKYVIELNAGDATKLKLKPGEIINL